VPPENPFISVIIPAYTAARYLPDAVASIRRQQYAPVEIIVVDDGSTDGTDQVVAQWSDVRYHHQENGGVSLARNVGIRLARGEIYAFLDADDLWTDDHLALLLPPLLANPQLRFVWGSSRWVRCADDGVGLREQEMEIESQPLFLVMAGLYRPEAFAEAGLFDESLRQTEDTDWIAKARQC
jgi:glycosyltransferase involved in cell wall biosynthesis